MAYENSTGLNVFNHYGARNTGGSVGAESTSGSVMTVTYHLTGADLNGSFIPPVVVPKGAVLKSAYLIVDEAFVVSAAGTVAIGAAAAPGTNGVVLTEAKLEALGSSDVTSLAVGTWAANSATGTASASKIGKAITGTVGATAGKAQLVMEFVNRDKV